MQSTERRKKTKKPVNQVYCVHQKSISFKKRGKIKIIPDKNLTVWHYQTFAKKNSEGILSGLNGDNRLYLKSTLINKEQW